MKRSVIVAFAFIGLAEMPTQAQPGNFDAKHPARFEDFCQRKLEPAIRTFEADNPF